MIADTFRKDYRQMTAQGVKFTPEDIVRLNALAVKVKLSQTAARDVHLPRLAFLPRLGWWRGEIVLREPTIAHELWMERAAQWIDIEDDRNFYFLNGYALSRPAERLADAFRARRVIREVDRFAAKRLALYPPAQLSAAVDYVLYGADWTVGEHGPDAGRVGNVPGASRPGEPKSETSSIVIGLLTRGRALRLPISLDDAMRMTASELQEAVERARAADETIDWEKTRHRAFGEYVRARNEIRNRNEKAATAASSEPRQKTPQNESSKSGESQ